MASGSILDAYVTTAPSPQNALDIFKGEWAAVLPAPYDHYQAGQLHLFYDNRAFWALQQLGGCEGQSVLELGPCEGQHAYMLEQWGAASITSIEANTRHYLKCLIVKEVLRLQRVHFLCGDFNEYLEQSQERFDLIFSAGVLYHMRDPVGLIAQIARHTSRVYIWTHYYDHDIIRNNPHLKRRFGGQTPSEAHGFRHTLNRQEYKESLAIPGFSGGTTAFSNWLSREDLLGALKHFGFNDIRIANEQRDHIHGPCMDIVAIK
jgi:SAM-dependent methyltransferase